MRLFALFIAISMFISVGNAQSFNFSHPTPTSNNFNDATILPNGTFVLVGDGGVVARSTNDGSSWTLSYPDTGMRDIYEATFVNNSIGYLCGVSGVLMKTTDGGATWAHLSAPSATTFWYLDFLNADTGLVVGNTSVILKTTNGGTSWSMTTLATSTTLYKVHYVNPSTAYIGTASATLGRLLRSTDYGTSWISVPGYTGLGTTRGIFFINPDTGWVSNTDYVIFKTTDRGVSFVNQADFGTGTVYEVKFADALNGIGIGATGGTFTTTNGGANWAAGNIGYDSNVFGVGLEGYLGNRTTTPRTLVAGVNGAIAVTTDWGTSWIGRTQQLTQEDLRDVQFINRNVGFAVGGSATTADSLGEVMRTTNGGAVWSILPYNPRHRVYSTHWLDVNNGFLATRGPDGIFKTTDGGATFSQQTPGLMTSTGIWYKIRFANTSTGFAAGSGGVMVKTTNGGATWTDVPDGHGTSVIYSMHVFDSNNLISIGASSKVYRSTNGGTGWTTQAIPGTSTTLYDVTFVNDSLGFICAASGRVYRTTNGGSVWEQMTTPTTATLYGVSFVNSDSGWAVGTSGVVIRTTNRGANWSPVVSGSDKTFYEAHIATGVLWLAGAAGTILRAVVGDTTVVDIAENGPVLPGEFSLQQNFPNPFNPETTIGFRIQETGFVSIKVFDVLGREVATLVNEEMRPGQYERTWDGSAMASGVYLYRLTVGNHSATRKLLLMK